MTRLLESSTIALIAAVDRNGLLGDGEKMPWHLPAELQLFRRLTLGKPVIMGRKTFEVLGKPLEQRKNIILSDSNSFAPEGGHRAGSIEEAIKVAGDTGEIMVIGGATVYRQFMKQAEKIYLSVIEAEFEGDVYFPRIRESEWKKRVIFEQEANDKNPWAFTTYEYSREN